MNKTKSSIIKIGFVYWAVFTSCVANALPDLDAVRGKLATKPASALSSQDLLKDFSHDVVTNSTLRALDHVHDANEKFVSSIISSTDAAAAFEQARSNADSRSRRTQEETSRSFAEANVQTIKYKANTIRSLWNISSKRALDHIERKGVRSQDVDKNKIDRQKAAMGNIDLAALRTVKRLLTSF